MVVEIWQFADEVVLLNGNDMVMVLCCLYQSVLEEDGFEFAFEFVIKTLPVLHEAVVDLHSSTGSQDAIVEFVDVGEPFAVDSLLHLRHVSLVSQGVQGWKANGLNFQDGILEDFLIDF